MQLLVRPQNGVQAETPGFEYLTFRVHTIKPHEGIEGDTADSELGLVLLGGRCSVLSSRGEWKGIGRRKNVFSGLPYALYLPVETRYTITAETDCDLAFCSCRAQELYAPKLITPADIEIEIRGAGNATRQINKIIRPEFPAHRLLVVEVYTPGGNWSSYPPHKHDKHNPPDEVDLEEIYYYRIERPEGYAIQKVYTADRHLDETITVCDGEMVMVPEGYHPVVAAHGYNVYYLNVLAGSARSMAASDDPQFVWVRETWRDKDPRVPLVTREMENEKRMN